MPMINANKKNKIGANTDTAATASTPNNCPTKMVLIVPDNDCKILVNSNGSKKNKNGRHRVDTELKLGKVVDDFIK